MMMMMMIVYVAISFSRELSLGHGDHVLLLKIEVPEDHDHKCGKSLGGILVIVIVCVFTVNTPLCWVLGELYCHTSIPK